MEFDNYQIRLLQYSDIDAYYQLVSKNRERLEDFLLELQVRRKTLNQQNYFFLKC